MRPWAQQWTKTDILAAMHRFVERHGSLPCEHDWSGTYGLPSPAVRRRLFGSSMAVRQSYIAMYGPVETDQPPAHPGRVPCLRCGRWWVSPDRRRQRICGRCHALAQDHDGGAWINGVVRDHGWYLSDLLDMQPDEAG